MLADFPLSGFAICYGPLFLMIAGFIAFAVLTDANARRTYLRRLDPRAESERPPLEPLPITKPVEAETPAGLKVVMLPEDAVDAAEDDAAALGGAAASGAAG